MAQPHDLTAFINQEKRYFMLTTLKDELLNTKHIFDNRQSSKVLEKRFYMTNTHCVQAEKQLLEYDLYAGTLLSFESIGISSMDHLSKVVDVATTLEPPHCVPFMQLVYSVHSFEHLESLKKRWFLEGSPEKNIEGAVLQGMTLKDYGHALTVSMTENSTSWVLYNMAAHYWRIKGNAFQAVECIRRALHLSPSHQQHIALNSLANVIHRTKKYTIEALIVLRASMAVSGRQAPNHYLLGVIYASIENYNKSLKEFEYVIELEQPATSNAVYMKHSLMCHIMLKASLLEQQKSLQRTLKELQGYQRRHKYWVQQQRLLVTEQASREIKLESQLAFQLFIAKHGRGVELCNQVNNTGRDIMECHWYMPYEDLPPNTMHQQDLHQPHSSYWNIKKKETDVNPLADSVSPLPPPLPQPQPPHNYDAPYRAATYTKWREESCNAVHLHPTWASASQCFTDANYEIIVHTTFVPMENIGFDIQNILTTGLNLTSSEHSLPWYPPVCIPITDVKGRIAKKYDRLASIKNIDTAPSIVDEDMKKVLKNFISRSEVSYDETGQRILTALKSEVGPKWLLLNAAGLYWRVMGNPYHSVACIRRALSHAPKKYRHIALNNLASVVYLLGYLDDAELIARHAYRLNPYEPDINFLLANIIAKSNDTGAIEHYLKTLQQKPDHSEALQNLLILTCQMKSRKQFCVTGEQCDKDIIHGSILDNETPAISSMVTMFGFAKYYENIGQCVGVDQCKKLVISIACRSNNPVFLILNINEDGTLNQEISTILLNNKLSLVFDYVTDSGKDGKNCVVMSNGMKSFSCFSKTFLEHRETVNMIAMEIEGLCSMINPFSSRISLESMRYLNELKDHLHEMQTDDTYALSPTSPTPPPPPPGSIDPRIPSPQDIDELYAKEMKLLEKDHTKYVHKVDFSLETIVCPEQVLLTEYKNNYMWSEPKLVNFRLYLEHEGDLPEEFAQRRPYCQLPEDILLPLGFVKSLHGDLNNYNLDEAGILFFKNFINEMFKVDTLTKLDFVRGGATLAYIKHLHKDNLHWKHEFIASLYWRSFGDARESVTCLLHAYHLMPASRRETALFSLVQILCKTGNLQDAFILAKLALAYSPRSPVGHYVMGIVYIYMKRIDLAMDFQYYFQLKDTNFRSIKGVQLLNCFL